MCMAKIMQLAKDLLKGGNKEDIYPKTIDSAVFITNSNNNPTNNTLKGFWTDLDETLGQYMTTDSYAPVGIIVTPSKTALSGIDPTFGQLVDYAGSNPRRDMYVTYVSSNGNSYVLPLVKYTNSELIYATITEDNSDYIQVTINSDGSINSVLNDFRTPFYVSLHTSQTTYSNFVALSNAVLADKFIKVNLTISGGGGSSPYVGTHRILYLTEINTTVLDSTNNLISGTYTFEGGGYKAKITSTNGTTATVTVTTI